MRRCVGFDGGALAREAVTIELAFAGDPDIPERFYQPWHGAFCLHAFIMAYSTE
jgi:hypothetical protein